MFSKLFYKGPGLLELGERYAKQRRLDQQAQIVTARETVIDARVTAVWRLISDPLGWPAFDPGVTDVQIEGPVEADVEFRRSIGRTKVRAILAVVEPEREISWAGEASGGEGRAPESARPGEAGIGCP